MSGASPVTMSRTGWILGSFLAALAGVLLAQQQSTALNPYFLSLLVVNSFAAAVVGRLRSVNMTYVGALILGLLVTYFQSYAVPHLGLSWGPDLLAIIPMVFLFGALVALPSVRLRAVGRLSTLKPPRVAAGWESLGAGVAFLVVAGLFSLTITGVAVDGISNTGLIADQTMTLGIVGLSLVLIIGYAGQVSLCQFSFMGIGAVVMGKVAGGGSLVGLIASVAICAAIGALIALPAIRLRGLYLALATFAFADAMYSIFPDTHVLGQGLDVGQIILPGLSFAGNRAGFLLVAVAFVLCAWLVLAIRRSLFGRRLVALNDSPAACATIGLNAPFTKVAVFAIAAGLAGLAGALYRTTASTVGPSDFDIFSGVMFVLFVTGLGHPHGERGVHGGTHLRRAQPRMEQRRRALRRCGDRVDRMGPERDSRHHPAADPLPWVSRPRAEAGPPGTTRPRSNSRRWRVRPVPPADPGAGPVPDDAPVRWPRP